MIRGTQLAIVCGWNTSFFAVSDLETHPQLQRFGSAAVTELLEQFPKMKKQNMNWRGVIPAMTTAFKPDLSVDHAFVAKHARWLVDNGCAGVIALGSLGESATLHFDEKI